MKNKLLIFFTIVSIIIQRVLYTLDCNEYLIPFLYGVPISTNSIVHNLQLIKWYVPIFFIINYFSGSLDELLNGYGILMIIRKYNKTKLLLKKILTLKVVLIFFVLFQIITFIFFPYGFKYESIEKIIIMLLMYFLFLQTMILLQFYLEFFLSPQIANIAINIFIILSIILTNTLYNTKVLNLFKYLFFSNLGMGFRNGIIDSQSTIIHYSYGIIILLLLNSTLIVLSINKLRKKDLY